VAVMVCVPLLKTLEEMLQLPPVAVAEPTSVTPSNSLTVLPASAVPVKVGVVALVLLSTLEEPLSLPAAKSGVEGAFGAVVSIVTASAAEAGLTFPAASVAVAV